MPTVRGPYGRRQWPAAGALDQIASVVVIDVDHYEAPGALGVDVDLGAGQHTDAVRVLAPPPRM